MPSKPRVVYFAHSDRSGPTSRYRIYPFADAIAQAGVTLDILPAFKSSYYEAERYSGVRRLVAKSLAGIEALLRRLCQLPAMLWADGVVIERELFPFWPPLVEYLVAASKGGYVLEFDDALYLARGRRFKYPALIRMARRVIVGNQTLAAYATALGARSTLVPTVIDVNAYSAKTSYALHSPARLGWIGLASNFGHLASIAEALRQVCTEHHARLVVVSARRPTLHLPLDFVLWREEHEAEIIAGWDVGLMPLVDTAFARAKCGLKLLQYMAAGVPALGSPVGVNRDIIAHENNGLLAASHDEWVAALGRLLSDQRLRERVGRAGRHCVETEYSLAVWAHRVAEIYRELFSRP